MLSDYSGLVEKKKLGNLLQSKNYIRTPLPNNQTWFKYMYY